MGKLPDALITGQLLSYELTVSAACNSCAVQYAFNNCSYCDNSVKRIGRINSQLHAGLPIVHHACHDRFNSSLLKIGITVDNNVPYLEPIDYKIYERRSRECVQCTEQSPKRERYSLYDTKTTDLLTYCFKHAVMVARSDKKCLSCNEFSSCSYIVLQGCNLPCCSDACAKKLDSEKVKAILDPKDLSVERSCTIV